MFLFAATCAGEPPGLILSAREAARQQLERRSRVRDAGEAAFQLLFRVRRRPTH